MGPWSKCTVESRVGVAEQIVEDFLTRGGELGDEDIEVFYSQFLSGVLMEVGATRLLEAKRLLMPSELT